MVSKPNLKPTWADNDVQLPNAQTSNKLQPTSDLQDQGIDYGQQLTAQEFNWIVNNIKEWVDFFEQQVGVQDVYIASNDADAAEIFTGNSVDVSAYNTEDVYWVKWPGSGGNSTTTPTLDVDGLGAITVVALGGSTLAIGDLQSEHVYPLWYNGTNFVVITILKASQVPYDSSSANITSNHVKDAIDDLDSLVANTYTKTEADGKFLDESNNLSDLDNASTARSNLGGLYTKTEADGKFLEESNNLSDLDNASTARSNLGLGSNDAPTFDKIQFNNNESSDATVDGHLVWDLSDGLYTRRGGTAYQVWDSGNDGSGSGLNADLLDGKHASEFSTEKNPTGTSSGDFFSEEVSQSVSGTEVVNCEKVNGYKQGTATLVDIPEGGAIQTKELGTTTNNNGNLDGLQVNEQEPNDSSVTVTVRFSGVVE